MVTRELDAAEAVETAGLDDLARELAVPLGEITDALDRAALQRLRGGGSDTAAPDLLWRARHLADELTRVVSALSALPAVPKAMVDGRGAHAGLLVRHAIARAADACAESLGARRVVVRCSPQLAITTQPGRFHELLVVTIDETARRRSKQVDVRVGARRVGNRLVIEAEGGLVGGEGIERLHHLARAIGGRIEVVSGPETRSALRIHIPQWRTNDLDDLPDDVA